MGLLTAAILTLLVLPIGLVALMTGGSAKYEFLKWLGLAYVVLILFAYLSGVTFIFMNEIIGNSY